ncbi:hypothetical protein FPOAC2_04681 [Fusarium poae]|uniref:Uncharacterized protein n=1 Tax=Fusarium poae TaxID=36050 RepID=A0A1B8ASU9_FUSPO|nr:hypothetical protein FPOA_04143 [Fusarium poae]
MKPDDENFAAIWWSPFLKYGGIALFQIAVLCLGSQIHRDIHLSSPELQQCFRAHSQAMVNFAVIMVLAEWYASIVVVTLDGPFIIIIYIFIAQLFVTLLYFLLPFEYYDMAVEEEERLQNQDEEKMSMMDEDEDLDRILSLTAVPASVVSTPRNDKSAVVGYGTMANFRQMPGPGNSSPV